MIERIIALTEALGFTQVVVDVARHTCGDGDHRWYLAVRSMANNQLVDSGTGNTVDKAAELVAESIAEAVRKRAAEAERVASGFRRALEGGSDV